MTSGLIQAPIEMRNIRQVRKFNPYPLHQKTGLDWLGDVPRHWRIKRLRFHMASMEQGWSPQCDGFQADANEWGVLKVGCVNGIEFDESENKALPADLDPLPEYEIKSGDILMSRANTRELLGSAALVRSVRPKLLLCDKLYRIRIAKDQLDSRFLVYAFGSASSRFHFERDATGTSGSMKNIGQDTIKNLWLASPPLDEQRAIATFLDRETARIDALVAKKRRLIELLQEKRTALISHAVTKGLNPAAPMKPSGIDWLGDVPAHWQMKRLGYLVTIRGGCTPDSSNLAFWDGDIPWVTPKDMKVDVLSDSIDHVTHQALQDTGLQLIQPPAVLIVVRGMILAHTIPVGLSANPVTVNQDMKALIPRKSFDAEFFAWLLRACAPAFFALIEESGHGTRVLRTDLWTKQYLPIPPIEEQRAITKAVLESTASIERLREKIETAIEKLQEYRTALISAAVTGKIDVRDCSASGEDRP